MKRFQFRVWGRQERTYNIDAEDEDEARRRLSDEAEWDFDEITDVMLEATYDA